MKNIILLSILLLPLNYLFSQNITGNISDKSGQSLDAVTVFIPNVNVGLLSNSNGVYQAAIGKGNFTLIYRLPGYKDVYKKISLSEVDTIHIDVVLEQDSLIISDKDKSTANNIIKHSIDKSPSYFNGLKYYKAGNYIKGQLVAKRFSNLVDKLSYRLHKFNISKYKGQLIIQELYNYIEYHYPNVYNIQPDAQLGYIPEIVMRKGATGLVESSIYSEKLFGKISPISYNAFRYYKFSYNGYYKNNESKRHKIKVASKYNDPELFNGYLYINDDTWSVDCAVLISEEGTLKQTTTIMYAEIQEGISIPVTFFNDIDFDLVPSAGNIKFYSGLKYFDISDKEYDTNLPEEYVLITSQEEICWNKVRMQPKSDDTEVHLPDSINYLYAIKKISSHWLSKIIIGGYIAGDESTTFSARYNGVKMVFRDYNYVDGFWLGNKFDLKWKRESDSFEAYPYIYYATAREKLIAGSDVFYNYLHKKKGQLSLKFGSRSEDFNNLSLTRYQNYFTSLLFGENENFFYQRDFITAGNNIYLNKKLKLSVAIGIERRSGLSNHTDFSILGNNKKIKPNIFPDDRFDRTYYSVGLTYSPNSNYSINDALEMNSQNVNPVFNVEYSEGFSSWQTNNSTYKKLKGGIIHKIKLDHFNYIDYKMEGGVFLEKGRRMHFADYQHFGASDMLLNLNSLFDSFLLLDNYELQTNRYWINLFLNYSGKYVLLKFIPFLQGKPFTENLHLKTLFTPEIKSYVEAGYSISFNRYFGIGAFTSFHNVQGKKFGIRLSLNLRSFNLI